MLQATTNLDLSHAARPAGQVRIIPPPDVATVVPVRLNVVRAEECFQNFPVLCNLCGFPPDGLNCRVFTHLVVLHFEDAFVVIVADVDPCLLLADLAEGGPPLLLPADHDTVSHLGAHSEKNAPLRCK